MAANGRIHRLDSTVVDRIAAGEVIQRPANALKELIENSLDAGATSITITVRDGGLKLLQVQDNGCGICPDDLAIVCERHTTSKLTHFDDLHHIATYGFRGEALASITHVARVRVVSKRRDESVAYQARYEDGAMLPFLPSDPAPVAQPCAGSDGTVITAEDMFHNVPTRRRALASPADEHRRIVDVVARYALHNCSTSFVLRVAAQPAPVISSAASHNRLDVARRIFGAEMLQQAVALERADAGLRLRVNALLGHPSSARKRGPFILFINHRAVESDAIQRAVLDCYSPYLAKGSRPFVYVALQLPPEHVDVNVHPTKSQVHVLNESTIIETLERAVREALDGLNAQRSFAVNSVSAMAAAAAGSLAAGAADPVGDSAPSQLLASPADAAAAPSRADADPDLSSPSSQKRLRAAPLVSPSKLVRTDDKARSVLTLFSRMDSGGDEEAAAGRTSAPPSGSSASSSSASSTAPPRLTSVANLLAVVARSSHEESTRALNRHTFVGVVDRRYALVQYSLDLLLLDVCASSREWAYQQLLLRLGTLSSCRLDVPLVLDGLVRLALEAEPPWLEHGTAEELSARVAKVLGDRAALLHEYFGLRIADGAVEELPLVWRGGFLCSPERLPAVVMRLALVVDWKDEQPCLDGIAVALSDLYAVHPHHDSLLCDGGLQKPYGFVVEHHVMPALRTLQLPASLAPTALRRLANLTDLYKVFERC